MSDNSKNFSTFKVLKKDNNKETIDLDEMLQNEFVISHEVLNIFRENNTRALILLEKKGVGIRVVENGITLAAIAIFIIDEMKNSIDLRQSVLNHLAEDFVDIVSVV